MKFVVTVRFIGMAMELSETCATRNFSNRAKISSSSLNQYSIAPRMSYLENNGLKGDRWKWRDPTPRRACRIGQSRGPVLRHRRNVGLSPTKSRATLSLRGYERQSHK